MGDIQMEVWSDILGDIHLVWYFGWRGFNGICPYYKNFGMYM